MAALTPNAQRLLRTLVTDGPAYRADLARSLDVTRATITNLAKSLVEDGWVEEPPHEPGAIKNLIGTAPALGVLASVVYLVDVCTVTLSRLDGRVLSSSTVSGPELPASDRLKMGADLLDSLLENAGLTVEALRAVHLAVDTQMDARTGDVYAQRASSRWYGVNPTASFRDRFGVAVYPQNTARLEGFAEYLWGAGSEHDNVLAVDVSFGVTSGHITGGVIQSGARGGSGELGHTVYDWSGPLCSCGNTGCVMQYVSVPALLREYASATGEFLLWPAFTALVAADDDVATTIVTRAAAVLARVLMNASHLIDPDIIVLSGEVSRVCPSFVTEVEKRLREIALPLVGRHVEVAGATLQDVLAATARAGIESLRRIDDVVSAAIDTSDGRDGADHGVD